MHPSLANLRVEQPGGAQDELAARRLQNGRLYELAIAGCVVHSLARFARATYRLFYAFISASSVSVTSSSGPADLLSYFSSSSVRRNGLRTPAGTSQWARFSRTQHEPLQARQRLSLSFLGLAALISAVSTAGGVSLHGRWGVDMWIFHVVDSEMVNALPPKR